MIIGMLKATFANAILGLHHMLLYAVMVSFRLLEHFGPFMLTNQPEPELNVQEHFSLFQHRLNLRKYQQIDSDVTIHVAN